MSLDDQAQAVGNVELCERLGLPSAGCPGDVSSGYQRAGHLLDEERVALGERIDRVEQWWVDGRVPVEQRAQHGVHTVAR